MLKSIPSKYTRKKQLLKVFLKNKKSRMQRLGDPTGESVGRPSPTGEI